ncbi:Spy/CpxP family protein refolding chaperone [Bradyrhizobium sp. USDA 4486]
MKLAIVVLSAAALTASATGVFAQSSVSSKTPGHEMQSKGSKMGSPGASGYSPGHEMQAKGAKKGSPGASGYAPGQTTGSTSGAASSSTKR